MNHGVDVAGAPETSTELHAGAIGWLDRAMAGVNKLTTLFGMIALLIASLVLTYSVFSRYLFKAATDWQDEVAVFCIVGAGFLAGAWGELQRGHVGIEAVARILPRRSDRVRRIVVDILTLAVFAFFAWE